MRLEALFRDAAPRPLSARAARRQEDPPEDLLEMIDQAVAGAFDISAEALMKPSRGQARIALARQVAMYLAHVGCGLSFTEIGDLFGRDRTTVAHACTVVEARRDDESFDRAVDLLEGILRVLVGAVDSTRRRHSA